MQTEPVSHARSTARQPREGRTAQPGLGNGTQGQGNPGTEINPFNPNNPNNSTGRPFANRGRSLFGLGLLSGITGTIFYGIALLVSLAAAVGMFLTKRWGQVLGIVMGIVYLILALVSFLPTILLGFGRGLNFLSLGPHRVAPGAGGGSHRAGIDPGEEDAGASCAY